MEAAGAATPFLRGARDTQKGEPAAYIIYSDYFSDWLTDLLTYLLTDYELISRREEAEMKKFQRHSIPWQFSVVHKCF
jgi:hypothetical protein